MSGPAAPFSLGEGDDACLLLHGLTGAPAEVRPVGEALARAGFRAVGPLLPGHGTSPQDLEAVTRSDMLDAAREALLSLRGARRVYLCGLSMGALLAVRLAAKGFVRQGVAPVSALALLAPAVEMAGLTWVFTQVLGRLPAFPGVIGKGARDVQALSGVPPPDDRVPEGDPAPRTAVAEDGSYTAVPWRWGRELRLLSEEAMAVAGRVRARALILHGGRDRTASLRGARRLSRSLSGSAPVRVFPRSGHVLPLDVDGPAVCDAIVSFFQEG
ncbi:MAG TPA: alpha/beta fold hydrolase [Myxococcales bacterium]